MSTSWRSSFPHLPAPHTTPVTTNPTSLKRPIHNPYDKFTKPEFDNWISGITSALRRALGEESEEDAFQDEHQSPDVHSFAEETFQDRSFEDSFADTQSRRAKGKAKDPREGPGLGAPQNPIELLSESDSGSELESVQSDEEYDDYAEREGEDSDANVGHDAYDGYHQPAHWALSGHYPPVGSRVDENEVKEISSREETPDIIEVESGREDDFRASVHRTTYSAAQYNRSPQLPPDEMEDELGSISVALDKGEDQLDAEVEDFPPLVNRRHPSVPIDLPDPWQGPRTYAEDFYSGGDFSVRDTLHDVSPSSLTPMHDARLAYFSHVVHDDGSFQVPSKSEPSVINVDIADDALPDSSPPPSSPIEQHSGHNHMDDHQHSSVRSMHEASDNILDHLYRDAEYISQDEQQMMLNSSFDEFHRSPTSQSIEHLDWNWPPAFPEGKLASRAGHLETPPSKSESDLFEEGAHNEDVIDLDAECNRGEDEQRSDEVEGPIPLGTSDLVYGTDIEQDGQGHRNHDSDVLDVELVDDGIRALGDGRLPLPADSRLTIDEHAAMESFFDLLNSREASPANEHAKAMPVDVSSVVTDPIDRDATSLQSIDEAGDEYQLSAPSGGLEPVNGQSRSPYRAELSTSIKQTKSPITEVHDQPEDVSSENVEESLLDSAVPTSAAGDTKILAEEQPDEPNSPPVYMVVEMEVAAPVLRGLSEEIEVVSFAGEAPDLNGEYVVEEPPITEPSVGPEDGLSISVDVLVGADPVTPMPAPVELSSSDNHNVSPFPMPILCDPSAVDPISSSETEHPPQTPPRLINLPGAPRVVLSPHPTPGQPTPVSVSVSTSMLHTFSRRVSPSEGSSGQSGLFTPREGEVTGVGTGDAFDADSPSHSTPVPLSADEILASVTTTLTDEPQTSSDMLVIDDSDKIVAQQSLPGLSAGDHQHAISESEDLRPDLSMDRPLSVDGDEENKNNQSSTMEPDAGHNSAENFLLKSEEVRQAVDPTQPAIDQNSPSSDSHLEETLPSVEVSSPTVPAFSQSPPLPECLIDQDPFQPVVHNDQAPPGSIAEGDNQEDTVSHSGLGNVLGKAHESPASEPGTSHDIDDQGYQTKPVKRKRMMSVQSSSRLTRSMSDVTPAGSTKSRGGREAEREMPVRGRKRKHLRVKDSGSDTGSISSGASTAIKMLHFASTDASRASSVVSTAPSDSSSIQPHNVPPPFFHAHGAIHHRHGPPPPPVPVHTQVHAEAASPEFFHNPDGRKGLASASAMTQSPSVQHIAASTSSPVTRSNCRFHKISLPKEEGGPRVCFVVPGCSLGNKELMDEQEILDHGAATHEDYSRLVGNIEALDFNPYLIGILRQLVGVDLLRENEVFYLLQPGEEAHFKKRSRRSTAASKLASSTARNTPTSPQVSVASRRSPGTSISRPPVSSAESVATSLSEAHSYKHSSLFSASGGEMSDVEGSASFKSKRRRKELAATEATFADEKDVNIPQDSSTNAPRISSRILKRNRSKRQVADSAAYKPHSEDEDDSDEGTDGLDKGRRKVKKSKGKKRPRADEEPNAQVKKQKQKHASDE